MKTWAGVHPPKPLGEPRRDGFYWCLGCHRVTEPEDPGDAFRRCVHCKSARIEWKETPPDERETIERLGMTKPRRLHASERDFRELSRTGYHFCNECQQVTKLEGEACGLCGSSKVEWVPPVPGLEDER